MAAFFASCLAVSLILDALTIFSQDRTRWRYRTLLVVVLILVWVLFGLLLLQIVDRTSSVVSSAKVWAPERLPATGRDAAILLAPKIGRSHHAHVRYAATEQSRSHASEPSLPDLVVRIPWSAT